MLEEIRGNVVVDQGMDRKERGKYQYDDNRDFTSPVLVAGTNKAFKPYMELQVMDIPSEEKLGKFIEACAPIDNSLTLHRIPSLSEMEVVTVDENFLVLKGYRNNEPIHYYLYGPQAHQSATFQKFSQLIGVPYSFSKKSPGFVNQFNFDYWKKASAVISTSDISIEFIVVENPEAISITAQSGQKFEVQAHMVVGIHKVKGVRGRKKKPSEESTMETPPEPLVIERIPMFSRILKNICESVDKINPELSPGLQSYSIGYQGKNQGNHFARLVFNHPDLKIQTEKELFSLGLNVSSNFTGTGKDFGLTEIQFVLFRQICSNGAVAPWRNEDREEILQKFVYFQLKRDEVEEGSKEWDEREAILKHKFQLAFKDSLKISVDVANTGLENTGFPILLDFFIGSTKYFQELVASLSQQFGQIDEQEFVETVLSLAGDFKIQDKNLIKYFLIEYMARNLKNKQKFLSPMDIANYLTLLCRASDTAKMQDMEAKALKLAQRLAEIFILGTVAKRQSMYHRYRSLANPELVS